MLLPNETKKNLLVRHHASIPSGSNDAAYKDGDPFFFFFSGFLIGQKYITKVDSEKWKSIKTGWLIGDDKIVCMT